jgi:hypothetical protein
VDYFAHSVKREAKDWYQDESIECGRALLQLSLTFHCNYTVVLHREREATMLEGERLIAK